MLIADADEMLAQLEEAAYQAAMEAREQAEQISRMAYESGQPPPAGTWATPPPAEPVNVERAVCQLLLGRVEDAAYSLGMGSEPTPYPLDPEVERFVAERSPSGDYAEAKNRAHRGLRSKRSQKLVTAGSSNHCAIVGTGFTFALSLKLGKATSAIQRSASAHRPSA